MPYTIRKIPNKQCYRVSNSKSKKVFSKCASKENAQKQMKLLRGLQYNKTFRQQVKTGSRRRRSA